MYRKRYSILRVAYCLHKPVKKLKSLSDPTWSCKDRDSKKTTGLVIPEEDGNKSGNPDLKLKKQLFQMHNINHIAIWLNHLNTQEKRRNIIRLTLPGLKINILCPSIRIYDAM